jgi:2-polyprenyl-3-methyl-5-hydroxy-6-metoxy-1,4-benzoquinol methylase
MAKQTKFKPIDDADFFAQSVSMGHTSTHYNDLVRLHQNGAEFLRNRLGATSVFEIGSGLGFFLIGCNNIGLNATGSDINKLERDFAISKGVREEQYILSSLDKVEVPKTDVVYSTEVFEHVPDEMLHPLLAKIGQSCKFFCFTSTPYPTTPEQDAKWGHINLKQKAEWIKMFEKHGLEFHSDNKVITDWGMLFRGQL